MVRETSGRATSTLAAFRASILHYVDDPAAAGPRAFEHFEDGLLLVRDGRVAECGPATQILPKLPADVTHHDHSGRLIVPGFVDTHSHYVQTDIIASDGNSLLDWLTHHTYPAERAFSDARHAAEVAAFYCDELLRNGTTTVLAFASAQPVSVDALFASARERRMRLITGKVMMDRNCPDYLRDDATSSYTDSLALIERWHGVDRLAYAVTPRFAPTSTPAQMELAGRLFADHPGVYLQSHLAETRAETAWASELYPGARSYLDIYDRHGQLGARAVFAHCLWLDDADRSRMAATGAAMSFCPSSNLFLGSGLFDLERARAFGVRVGLGTDIGAGTSPSLLRTLADAYKVLRLNGQALTAHDGFYLGTLGGARSLYLDARIGNFEPGKEADFVVLDPQATPLLARRLAAATSLEERLFALMTLGDDRAVAETYLLGEPAWSRDGGGSS